MNANSILHELADGFPEAIKPSKTHTILDASKLKTYQTCPRQFFYEYILGWRPDRSNIHLVFGQCWHDALEHMLLNGYHEDSIYDAFRLGEAKFRESFPDPAQDEIWFPKIPDRMFLALAAYAARWPEDFDQYEVLATEIAGNVAATAELVLTFRMDAILRNRVTGKIAGLEHKTGSVLSPQWTRQWSLNLQPNLYLHALKCYYGADEADSVIVNGTFFLKNKGTRGGKMFEFHREPITHSNAQMGAWFEELSVWLDLVLADYTKLAESTPDQHCLTAFPRNPESCSKYFGCAFHDFCIAWTNPLKRCSSPPPGFIVEHWDPTAREAKTLLTQEPSK